MPPKDGDTAEAVDFPLRTEVLIVGAGPTGLSLACGLARRGVDHLVIDHAPLAAVHSQSTMLDARTLEALDNIGASEPLIRRGVAVDHFALRDRDEKLIVVDFGALPIKYRYALMVPESVAESILSARLASYGSSVLRPATAVALQQDSEGVTVEVWDGSTSRPGSPARRSIAARYVVGCDGMRSQVRNALEIPFIDSLRSESFLMADVRMDLALPRSEVQLFLSGDGLLLVAPLPENRYRILAIIDSVAENPSADSVRELLATRGPIAPPALVHDVVWSTEFRVQHQLASHYRSGRVFLAGDAAHIHSPAGGQGMNAGIQDALCLANKLADVLAGLAHESTLNGYEQERRPVAEAVVGLTRRLSGIANMRGGMGPKIRNRAVRLIGRLPAFRALLAARLAGFAGAKLPTSPDEGNRLYVAALVFVALLGIALLASTRH